MKTIRQALAEASQELAAQHNTARVDAEILLAEVLSQTRAYLYSHGERELTAAEWISFQQYLGQRLLGHPIAHLIGRREFWSLPLNVSKATLIPRPETELVVELCLTKLGKQSSLKILDLGTGSGAIALALAKERPDWEIVATDISLQALEIAQTNAKQLGLANIRFYQSDWFNQLPDLGPFHAIISNPPYIAADDPHILAGDLRFEPRLALVGGIEGTEALEQIIEGSLARLGPEGLLLLEHGFDQKFVIASMLNRYRYQKIECCQDYQGHDRVSIGISS